MIAIRPLAHLVLSATLVGSVSAQFAPAVNTQTGLANPSPIAVADFNGDGFPDVAVADEFSLGGVVTLAGDGLGGIQVAASSSTSVSALAAGDITIDSVADLIGSQTFAVLQLAGSGTGTFTDTILAQCASVDVAMGDVTGDGNPDVVSVGAVSCIVESAGSGEFGSEIPLVISSLEPLGAVQVVDIDGDTDMDVVVAGGGFFSDCGVAVYFNSGGALGAPLESTVPCNFLTFATGLAVGDFDGDTIVDVMISYASGDDLLGIGDGLGSFTFAAIPGSSGGGDVAAGDFDGDGDLDAVISRPTADAVDLLDNDGTGSFTLTPFAVGVGPTGIAVSDLDADGNQDVIAVNSGDGTVSVLLNSAVDPTGVVSIGTGTPGCRGRIGTSADSVPFVGNPAFGVRFTNATPFSLGTVILGAQAQPAPLNVLGVILELQPPFVVSNALVVDGSGVSVLSLAIANDPGLIGLSLGMQGVWAEDRAQGDRCSAASLALVSSKALLITFQ